MFQLDLQSVPDRCEHFHLYMHQNFVCSLFLVCHTSTLLLNPLRSCLSPLGFFHWFRILLSNIRCSLMHLHLKGSWVFVKFGHTAPVLESTLSQHTQRLHTWYSVLILNFQNLLILGSFLSCPAYGWDVYSPLSWRFDHNQLQVKLHCCSFCQSLLESRHRQLVPLTWSRTRRKILAFINTKQTLLEAIHYYAQ